MKENTWNEKLLKRQVLERSLALHKKIGIFKSNLKKKIFITNKYCLSLPSFEMIPRNFISPLFAKIIKVLLPFNNNSI